MQSFDGFSFWSAIFLPNFQKTIAQFNVVAEEKNLEELLQGNQRLFNIQFEVFIVGSNKSVSKVKRFVCKECVINRKTFRTQIFDGKNGRGSRVPLAEGVDLPEPRDE